MAINKHFIHFQTKQKFEEELANNNILDTSICFIQNTREIYTHGTIYGHDDRYYTKEEVLEIVTNMYEEILKIIDFSTNSNEPDVPEEPEIPEEPVVEALGEITEDNTIVVNENLLSEGTYTLKYLDSSDNVINNFKPLGEFEI